MSAVGVLALQGGFEAHAATLRSLGHTVIYVRTPEDLLRADGLILPGGESTAQLRLIDRFGLESAMRGFHASGKPILATCAGLILAARKVTSPLQESFGFIDVTVERNSYGAQLESSEAWSDDGRYPLVLIRAPRIIARSKAVEVLATLNRSPVLVRQRNVTGATFHPELAADPSIHRMVFGTAREGRVALAMVS